MQSFNPTLSKYFISVGMFFREEFFNTLPYKLPNDFWESSSKILNPDVLSIPAITQIMTQIKNCTLTGNELKMFVHGKALESLALTLDYVYSHKKPSPVFLSPNDITILSDIKSFLEKNFVNPPSINALTIKYAINQQKLTVGFKHMYNMTIYNYIKRLRINKAVELLRDHNLLIIEIARQVGYSGDGHFQNAFKDIYGITPNQMRKEQSFQI